MTRLAKGRTTHLSADEIAAEMLRLYDEGPGEPSIRTLATGLGVTPRAIYHYFDTRDLLVEAAMGLVWEEAITDVLREMSDPVTDMGDPVEFFVAAAVGTRRAFGRHNRLAMHLGMNTQPSSRLSGVLAIAGSAFERMGVTGERAGLATYTYITYLIGSILIEASRWTSQHDGGNAPPASYTSRSLLPDDAPPVTDATADAIDRVIVSDRTLDPTNEAQFAAGLRHLVLAFADPAFREAHAAAG